MWRQLQQVAVTYVTRPTPLGWVFIAFAGVMPVVVSGAFNDASTPIFASALLGVAGMGLNALLATQLNWQFQHPRSKLMPGFKRSHMLAWSILMFTFGGVIPVLVMLPHSVSPWLALCCFATGVAVSQVMLLVNLAWIPLIIAMNSSDRWLDPQLLQPWVNADGYRMPVLMIGTGVAWTAAFWQTLRQAAVTEDDIRYVPAVVGDPDAKVSRTFQRARERVEASVAERRRRSSAWTTAWLDGQLRRVPLMQNWRRVGLVLVARQSPLAVLSNITSGMFVWVLIVLSAHGFSWEWNPERFRGLWFFVALASAWVALGPAAALARRIPLMAAERLLPMSNQAYADALLGACLWWTVRGWLALNLIIALIVYALPWQWLEKPTAATAAVYLVLSLSGVAYSYGVGMFCSPMQGCFPGLFAATTSALATLGLHGYWMSLETDDSHVLSMAFAAMLVVAALFFIHRARRLWSQKEMAATLADRFS